MLSSHEMDSLLLIDSVIHNLLGITVLGCNGKDVSKVLIPCVLSLDHRERQLLPLQLPPILRKLQRGIRAPPNSFPTK